MDLLLASIPSPGSNALEIGPLSFRAYGLMIAFGVIAAVAIAGRRFSKSGGGTADDMISTAVWAVPAGLVGARLYHVITDNQLYRSPNGSWTEAFQIWRGGLGIPGGVFLGALVGVLFVKSRGLSIPKGLDAAAPAIPVAQAIGRVGNYFNQELFGRPTDLPWAVEITDPVALGSVPEEYSGQTLFHPTFLYEGLWNLALAGLIVVLTRWGRLKTGRLFAIYMIGYGIGRMIMESLRIDPANTIAGLRVNTWMSGALIVSGLIWLLWKGPFRDTTDGDVAEADLDGDTKSTKAKTAKAEEAEEPAKADKAKADKAKADKNKAKADKNKSETAKTETDKANSAKGDKASKSETAKQDNSKPKNSKSETGKAKKAADADADELDLDELDDSGKAATDAITKPTGKPKSTSRTKS